RDRAHLARQHAVHEGLRRDAEGSPPVTDWPQRTPRTLSRSSLYSVSSVANLGRVLRAAEADVRMGQRGVFPQDRRAADRARRSHERASLEDAELRRTVADLSGDARGGPLPDIASHPGPAGAASRKLVHRGGPWRAGHVHLPELEGVAVELVLL